MGAAQAVNDAIPEAVFLSFGFQREAAVYASGLLTFILSAPLPDALTIPAGTTVRMLGGTVTYITVVDGTIAAGQTRVAIMARAEIAGAAANTNADTLTVITSPGVATSTLSVTNLAPITNGRDQETDAQRRMRFAEWVSTLARGTIASYRYIAMQAAVVVDSAILEQVNYVAVAEQPCVVDLYVHNGVGGTSDALLAIVESLIEGDSVNPGYRAAGSQVVYHAAADVPLNVSLRVRLQPGYALAVVRTGMTGVLTALVAAATNAIAVTDILNACYSVAGVNDLVLLAPTARITYDMDERPILGVLTLTEIA